MGVYIGVWMCGGIGGRGWRCGGVGVGVWRCRGVWGWRCGGMGVGVCRDWVCGSGDVECAGVNMWRRGTRKF